MLDGDTERWVEITTLSAAAETVGTELGAPAALFEPTTEIHEHEQLRIDNDAATVLSEWFAFVEAALEEVRRAHRERQPSIVQLWPEHFDLAFTVSEVNVGGSPGDGDHPEPYLYVGPWAEVQGKVWNESWGMSLAASAIEDEAAAVEFVEHGLVAAFAL